MIWRPISLGVLVGLLMILGLVGYARAHSWYDQDCCHDNDCGPVLYSSFVASDPSSLPSRVVTTKFGTAVIPRDFKRIRPSQDGQEHACIIGGRLICLYQPPNS
jgi:hypothetical protein